MRVLLALALVAVVAAGPSKWVALEPAQNVMDAILKFNPVKTFEDVWEEFKTKHNKNYESEEEVKRKEIFSTNLKKIEMHNYLHDKGLKTFTLGVNEYADMEHKEFVGIMNGLIPRNGSSVGATFLRSSTKLDLPKSVDWRDQGYVTPVKNQGQCGSCWSFSTTGSLEGQHFKKTGKLVSLSEQNLVDCSGKWGNNGCNGGLMDYAFQYVKDNGGIDTEQSYPYDAVQETCEYKPANKGATDVGYTDVTQGDEEALQEALATVGPVSIAIDASHQSFQLYKSGVYIEPECSSTALDHGVLAVGYGTSDDGQDYWIVKNSWGETWGQDGYIMMARNRNDQCGVASQASYPLV